MFLYFPHPRYEREYILWIIDMHAESKTNWLNWNIYPRNSQWNNTPITNTNGWIHDFYNTLYRTQLVYKQIQEVITNELNFGIMLVPNRTSVPLNGDTNLEQI